MVGRECFVSRCGKRRRVKCEDDSVETLGMMVLRSEALHSRCKAAKRETSKMDGNVPVLIPFPFNNWDLVDSSICLQEDFKVAPRLPVT